ncbi:MAG: hypothetical protein JO264_08070, partial [Acidisphaera sp.]|nr:hypothetical protein [Acidisphaera sp.]
MARHPGWVKFPATWVPRSRPASADPPPNDTPGAPTTALATSSAVAGLYESGAAGLDGLLSAAAPAFTALGIMLYPSRTASPEQDALPPELRPKPGRGGSEALVPPPRAPAPPGLVPPAQEARKPGEGGFTPAPPAPPLPGFTPAP